MQIEDIRRLDVKDGDTILFRTPDRISFEAVQRIKEHFLGIFPKAKIIILDGGATVDIISAADRREDAGSLHP